MVKRRAKGEGGLFRVKGSRFWRAQYIHNGKVIRVSTEELSNATVNRSLSCLRRMLKLAHEDSKLQFIPKIRFLKEPPARKGFVEQDKFDELIALLPTHLRPLVMLLYYCGVRVGEARQIEWPQVDLVAHIIRLEEEQTKGEEARIIPLPSVLVAVWEPLLTMPRNFAKPTIV